MTLKYKDKFKKLMFFEEPEKKEEFILRKNSNEEESFGNKTNMNLNNDTKDMSTDEDKVAKLNDSKKSKPELTVNIAERQQMRKKDKRNSSEMTIVSKNLVENLEYMKSKYSTDINGDIIIRELEVNIKNKIHACFIIFFDGLTDRKVIDDDILIPLMLLSKIETGALVDDIGTFVLKNIITHNQLKSTEKLQDIIDGVNFGCCGIFIEGSEVAFSADVKGWEHRTVGSPKTELVIRGPQEGFNELLRVNSGLIRKILKDEDLIVEDALIGKRSKTPCSMLYIKDIVNDSLVKEVRRRLKSIDIDYLLDSGQLEQLLEESSIMPAPQVLATERPDRVASMLTEGRVAIIVHGSPFVLVVPITNSDLIDSSEDAYLRFPYVNLLKLVRILGVCLSLLLPGLFLAVTTFHQEMIPTELLLAIAASREVVPFTTVIEIILMEISFELIREAGIRIPGPIGPTLGIIGALILGQAAVAAKIVSPVLIIIVAVTGIGSFAVPSFSLGFSFRIFRFIYILLGGIAGFFGIACGLFVHGLWYCSSKSFGVPFMYPSVDKGAIDVFGNIIRTPIWMQEKRPESLQQKDVKRQGDISRGWKH